MIQSFNQIRLTNQMVNASGGRLSVAGSGVVYQSETGGFATAVNLASSGAFLQNEINNLSGIATASGAYLLKAGDTTSGNFTFVKTGLGGNTTSTLINFTNTTVTTAAAPIQNSPNVSFTSQEWVSGIGGTGSQATTWRIYNSGISGIQAGSSLNFEVSKNSGSFQSFVSMNSNATGLGGFALAPAYGSIGIFQANPKWFSLDVGGAQYGGTIGCSTGYQQGCYIDLGEARLIDVNNNNSVCWNDYVLRQPSNGITVDWSNKWLQCASNTIVDWGNSLLNYSGGTVSVAWQSGLMLDTGNVNSLDWIGRRLSGTWNAQNLAVSGFNVVTTNQTGSFANTANLAATGASLATWTGNNQFFTTSITPTGTDNYFISFPHNFSVSPKVSATLEVTGSIIYGLAISNRTISGYTVLFSDYIAESGVVLHTYSTIN